MSQGFIQNLISSLTGIGLGTPASGNLANCTGYPLPTNYVLSSSCGAYTQSTSTPTQVTNLSCTITTTGGYVVINTLPDTSGNESYVLSTSSDFLNFYLYRGASLLTRAIVSGENTYNSPSVFSFIDYSVVGVPGTYTYYIFAATNSGTLGTINHVQLSVTEL